MSLRFNPKLVQVSGKCIDMKGDPLLRSLERDARFIAYSSKK